MGRLFIIVMLLLIVGCANRSIESRISLLYANKDFMSGDITVDKGCSMVITPVVYKGEFLKAPSIESLAEPLISRHDFLKIHSLEKASLKLTGAAKDSLLELVPQTIKKQDILGLGSVAPLLRRCDIAFFQTVLIKDFAKIRTSSGAILRKVALEIEIWDSAQRQALWRAEGEVRTLNERFSDEEVVMSAIKELYQELPKFYFNTVHESW